MQFNLIQKRILIGAAVLLVGLGLFVPWNETLRTQAAHGDYATPGYNSSTPIGYRLIFAPPKVDRGAAFGVEVDWPRVLVPMFVVCVVGAIAVVLTADKKPTSQNP